MTNTPNVTSVAVVFIRPGPSSLDAGLCPGGLVIQFYTVPDQLLIHTSFVVDNVEMNASDDAALVEQLQVREVCLVFFDGDTGERLDMPEGWTIEGPITPA